MICVMTVAETTNHTVLCEFHFCLPPACSPLCTASICDVEIPERVFSSRSRLVCQSQLNCDETAEQRKT